MSGEQTLVCNDYRFLKDSHIFKVHIIEMPNQSIYLLYFKIFMIKDHYCVRIYILVKRFPLTTLCMLEKMCHICQSYFGIAYE